MTGSMYAAIAGLQTHMQKMNVIGNNIANGICAALPTYVVMKISAGKIKEIRPVMWVLVAVCLLYFYSIV